MTLSTWKSTDCPSPGERGFSLIELMVSLVVMTVMFAIGVPAMGRYLKTNNTLSGAGNLAAEMRLARSKAVSEENSVIFSWSLADDHYRWHDDDDSDGVADNGEYISDWRELANGVDLIAGVSPLAGTSVTFRANGSASQGGQLKVTNSESLSRTIQLVAASGLVKVTL